MERRGGVERRTSIGSVIKRMILPSGVFVFLVPETRRRGYKGIGGNFRKERRVEEHLNWKVDFENRSDSTIGK